MPRRFLILALTAVVAGSIAVAHVSDRVDADDRAVAKRERPARVLFRDDFDGARLSRKRWRTCHWWAKQGCTIASNDELQWYLPEQVRVRRGRALLIAERRTVTVADGRSYPYASGMLSTGPTYRKPSRFAFTYGRAEIRARIPRGQGLWPAFWLLPADRESRPEIDVMEAYGDRPDTVKMHLHYVRDGERESQRHVLTSLSPGWHRFAIDWRPGRLAWLVDGVVRWRVRGPEVPSEPMYLVLNLAVGGDGPGRPAESTRFPARYAIDWVKVTR